MDSPALDLTPDDDAAAGVRRVFRNITSLGFAYVLPRACTFAAAVIAARALGVAAFGEWGSAAALAVILSVTATLGMMQLLIREIALAPERAAALIGAANIAKLAAAAFMLVCVAILAGGPLDFGSDGTLAALLLAVAYAIGAFVENIGAWFQGTERMGVWMQAQTLFGLVTGLLGIVLALTTRDLVWFCTAPVAGQIAALAWLLRRAPPAVRSAWTAPFPEVRRLVSALLPFAAAFLLLTAYYKVDILLLGRWRGEADAGVYAAAYRFVDVAQALAVVVATALYPRLSRLAGRDGGPAARSVELVLLAAIPASALLWLVRAPLVDLLFGAGYLGAGDVLGLLAPALPFLALNALATFVLAARGRTGSVAAAYAVGLLLNVALNAVWIPGLGATGAARAMLASEAGVAIALAASMARHAKVLPRLSVAIPLATAAVLPVPIAAMGWSPLVGAWAYIAATATLYTALRVVPAAERSLFRRAVAG